MTLSLENRELERLVIDSRQVADEKRQTVDQRDDLLVDCARIANPDVKQMLFLNKADAFKWLCQLLSKQHPLYEPNQVVENTLVALFRELQTVSDGECVDLGKFKVD